MHTLLKATGLSLGMAIAWLGSGAAMGQSRSASTAPTTKPAPVATPATQAGATTTLFADWDTNHDRMLSPAEFAAGWQRLQAGMALRRLHEQFVAMDTSKDGCLDATEYAHLELVRKAGASAPPLSAFDTKKNQCLDFKEYVNLVNDMVKRQHAHS
jgi:Ca2+-binding EF-hand superfamily protein